MDRVPRRREAVSVSPSREHRSRTKSKKRKRSWQSRTRSSSSSTDSRSSSSDGRSRHRHKKSSNNKKKSKRKDKKRKHSKKRDTSSDSSSSIERKKKKAKKKKKKIKKKEKQKAEREKLKSLIQSRTSPLAADTNTTVQESETQIGASIGPSPRVMKPMTKEEWDKQQSVMRHVYDPETGRNRLIKGDGEVMEEIVSRERHLEINKQATKGDGLYYQSQTGLLK